MKNKALRMIFDSVAELIGESEKTVALTGAGISVKRRSAERFPSVI